MMKKKMLTTYQLFIILGVLPFIIGEHFLDDNIYLRSPEDDFYYPNSYPIISTPKERCSEYPDDLPCHYVDILQNEDDKTSAPLRNTENNELTVINDTTPPGNSKILDDHNNKDAGIEVPVNSERRLEKRLVMFRRRNLPAKGYKRGPGFRSWGGKRDPSYTLNAVERRSKFTSWGGKRNTERTWNDLFDSRFTDNILNDKRTKFTSWGGKRNEGLEDNFENPDAKTKVVFEGVVKKDKESPLSYDFSQKRDPLSRYANGNVKEYFKEPVPKRPQFQSWGGKRSAHLPWYSPLELYFYPQLPAKFHFKKLPNGEEKRKFSSWGGKRSDEVNKLSAVDNHDFNPLENKEPSVSLYKKHVFQNWGGKRFDYDVEEPNAEIEENSDFTLPKEATSTIFDNNKQRVKREKTKIFSESPADVFMKKQDHEKNRR